MERKADIGGVRGGVGWGLGSSFQGQSHFNGIFFSIISLCTFVICIVFILSKYFEFKSGCSLNKLHCILLQSYILLGMLCLSLLGTKTQVQKQITASESRNPSTENSSVFSVGILTCERQPLVWNF